MRKETRRKSGKIGKSGKRQEAIPLNIRMGLVCPIFVAQKVDMAADQVGLLGQRERDECLCESIGVRVFVKKARVVQIMIRGEGQTVKRSEQRAKSREQQRAERREQGAVREQGELR
jgi:hypothetical protein